MSEAIRVRTGETKNGNRMSSTDSSIQLPGQERYLELFQEITRMITSTLDVDGLLDLIVKKIPQVMGVDAATIRLMDPPEKKLLLVAASGLSRKYLHRGPVDSEKSVTQAMAGRPVAIYDAATDPRVAYPKQAQKEGVKSILVAPIVYRGKVRGVLRLLTRVPRRFEKREIDFVTALAEQCGIAIENARAYDTQKRQLGYFTTLYEIGKALNATLQLNEVLDLIVDKLPVVMDLKGCTIRLLDPDKGHLELRAASGLSREYLDRGSIDDEIGTHKALRGEPVFIFDATADPRIQYPAEAEKEGVGSILAIPIIVRQRIIGVLRLLTGHKRYFNDAEINFAMAMGEQGGIAIQNAINYRKIMDLVTELEQHEEFLQKILDSLNADLFVIDKDLRITMVNRIFLKNHGLEESQIMGRPIYKILRVGETPENLHQLLDHHSGIVTFTRKAPRGDQDRYLEVMAVPINLYENDDKTDFIVGTIRDVSAHIRLKKELRTRERLQGVIEMAGAVAHELNNPLSIVLITAELLRRDLFRAGQSTEDLESMIKNLNRMSDLIKKMTHITQYKAKKYVGGTNIIDLDGTG